VLKELKRKGENNELHIKISDTSELRVTTPTDEQKEKKAEKMEKARERSRMTNLATLQDDDSLEPSKKDKKKAKEKERKKNRKEKEREEKAKEKSRKHKTVHVNMAGLGGSGKESSQPGFSKSPCPKCRMFCGEFRLGLECRIVRNGAFQIKALLESNYKSFNAIEKVNGDWKMTERMKTNLGFAHSKMGMDKAEIESFYSNVKKGIHHLKDKDKRTVYPDYRESKMSSNVNTSSGKGKQYFSSGKGNPSLEDKLQKAEQELSDLQDAVNKRDDDSSCSEEETGDYSHSDSDSD
jgi:hypothetical protein